MLVYLIHLSKPYVHARHYLGLVNGGETELRYRMSRHRNGTGSPLLAAAAKAGILFGVVRTWEGEGRTFERSLKRWKNAAFLCPVCCEANGKRPLSGRPRHRRKQAR